MPVLLPLVIILVIAVHFYSLRFPHVNNEYSEELDFEKEAEKAGWTDSERNEIMAKRIKDGSLKM